MYGDFILLEDDEQSARRAERLSFGDTSGRNEAWLRDTLFAHPDILPVREIAPAFGPLVPLCRELRTDVGPIDVAFINEHGQLTLVECKLWRNPEARRKVVAQVLDYASAISRWSYSDLQRQVAIASGRHGNVPYELVSAVTPGLPEHQFVDATAAALAQGRFLLLIAGDGIREDVGAMAELLNRHSGGGFSFGLVEIAMYGLDNGGALAIQPRILAKTQLIERTVLVLRQAARRTEDVVSAVVALTEVEEGEPEAPTSSSESPKQAQYRRWWQPVIDAPLDDPDQEPPRLYWPNHVRVPLPWPQTWLLAYASDSGRNKLVVCIAGRLGADQDLIHALESEREDILAQLPADSSYQTFKKGRARTFSCEAPGAQFADDDARRKWLATTINTFVNVLRPRIKRLIAARQGQ